jgi:hypothetical protein
VQSDLQGCPSGCKKVIVEGAAAARRWIDVSEAAEGKPPIGEGLGARRLKPGMAVNAILRLEQHPEPGRYSADGMKIPIIIALGSQRLGAWFPLSE